MVLMIQRKLNYKKKTRSRFDNIMSKVDFLKGQNLRKTNITKKKMQKNPLMLDDKYF